MQSPSITTTHPCPPKMLTHPPPPTLKNVPPTSTYPKKCSIHPHTPKMMPHLPHSPLPTQNNAPYNPTHPYPPKITHTHSKSCLTKRHSHKIWSNNPHLLKLLFDHKVKLRYELETYLHFHRMCMAFKLGRMDGDLGDKNCLNLFLWPIFPRNTISEHF